MNENVLYWTPDMHLGQKLTRYKAWANNRVLGHLCSLPDGASTKSRTTYFGSILHTLQHNYIVDDIFRAHLEGRAHGYEARRQDTIPALDVFRQKVEALDLWWIQAADQVSLDDLNSDVSFEFIGGEPGQMTRLEIIMHLANHTSYHRGFVDEILGQLDADGPASDFPVFLRDMKAPR